MSVHALCREQFIPAARGQVWEYFCDPRNLNEMTPPDMNFQIITNPVERMSAGQLIEYRVEFIHGLRSPWFTEIAHVRDQEYFVDEQRLGPYQFWYHEHKFEAVGVGTRMIDHVTYSIGFGQLGDLINTVWISGRLKSIFDFRAVKIKEIFPERSAV
jgi:ligand-binding SRPBCC domain-containing protein